MKLSKFQINGGTVYSGFTNGNHWNGWACPWFTKEVANLIATEVNADAPYTTMIYDNANDAFIYTNDTNETDVFKGTNGLYPIGNGSWIWDDINEWEGVSKQ